MTHTCATCPLAQHIDRDRYVCTAVHNHHSTQVVRGHWEATDDCESAIAQAEATDVETTEVEEPASPEYVMALEAALEKADERATQQQQFSEVAATTPPSIEVDSVKADVYRVWSGTSLLGTMRRTSAGWMVRPAGNKKPSWHNSPDAAQDAIVAAASIPQLSITAPNVTP